MSIERFVVVGASLAGLRAVEAARKAGHTGAITLIGAEEHLPYDRPPLSKAFLEPGTDVVDAPYFRDEATLRDELGVELLLGSPATGLDTRSRVVRVGDREIGYDALVIATGSTPRMIPRGRARTAFVAAHLSAFRVRPSTTACATRDEALMARSSVTGSVMPVPSELEMATFRSAAISRI